MSRVAIFKNVEVRLPQIHMEYFLLQYREENIPVNREAVLFLDFLYILYILVHFYKLWLKFISPYFSFRLCASFFMNGSGNTSNSVWNPAFRHCRIIRGWLLSDIALG